MLILLSPAKTLDFDSPPVDLPPPTRPRLIDHSIELIETLRQYNAAELGNLMRLSDKLAGLNHERFVNWAADAAAGDARPAIDAFRGDVYRAMAAEEFDTRTRQVAQDRLRILSGLYGVLRPLDLILPYRLEMGTRLITKRSRNLYEFWGSSVTEVLAADIRSSGATFVLNLASVEYAKVVDFGALGVPVISPVFEQPTAKGFRTVAIHAKAARGLMAAWAMQNGVDDPDRLRRFNGGGYRFTGDTSTPRRLVFRRQPDGTDAT